VKKGSSGPRGEQENRIVKRLGGGQGGGREVRVGDGGGRV